MKKIVWALAFVMMLSVFTACNKTPGSSGEGSSQTSQSEQESSSKADESSSKSDTSSSKADESSSKADTSSSKADESSSAAETGDKQSPDTGDMESFNEKAQALVQAQNEARAKAGQSELTLDEKLSKAAILYAEEMYAGGRDFRALGNYTTLPNGDDMGDMITKAGASTGGYNYNIWINKNQSGAGAVDSLIQGSVTGSDMFKNTPDDYTKVGIGCVSSTKADDPFSVVIIVYAK